MVKRFFKLVSLAVFLLHSGPLLAWEMGAFGGQETIEASEILPDAGAKGQHVGGRLLWTSSELTLGFGFTASSSQYAIASDESDEQYRVEKRGEMSGLQYGPTFILSLPRYVTPYVSSSLLVGDFVYELETSTSQTSGDSQLATDLKTKLNFTSQSLVTSVGLRSAGTWSFFGEAAIMRTLLTLSKAQAVATNRVDGEVVTSDSGEATLSDLFQALEGEKFHHSTSLVFFGVSYRL